VGYDSSTGISTTRAIARATLVPGIQCKRRSTPQYFHDSRIAGILSLGIWLPNSLPVGPTRTRIERTPVPSVSISSTRANASSPCFAAAYAPWYGRGCFALSEPMKTMSPRPRASMAGSTRRVM
jgi:hypothetical protein